MAKVRGLSDYLQHRMVIDNDGDKITTGEKDYSEEWKKSLYKDDDGCYIPSEHFLGCLIKAGVNFRVKGKGQTTFKNFVKANFTIEPDHIPLGKSEPDDIFQKFVVVQRNRILRSRPLFRKGWEVEFELILQDDIDMEILKGLFEVAGSQYGIGDWRPKYGRFELVSLEEK